MSTARVPHRVGRRRLRRLVEHRSTRRGSTAPRSVLEPVAPSGATGAVSPPTRPVQEAAGDADGAQALAERLHRAEKRPPVIPRDEPDPPRTERAVRAERLGHALRGLAAEHVAERRKVAELRREVAQLRSQRESVQPA